MTNSDIQIPVYVKGKKVGELPLATEYRILVEGLLFSAEADLQYYRKELKRLDTLIELLSVKEDVDEMQRSSSALMRDEQIKRISEGRE